MRRPAEQLREVRAGDREPIEVRRGPSPSPAACSSARCRAGSVNSTSEIRCRSSSARPPYAATAARLSSPEDRGAHGRRVAARSACTKKSGTSGRCCRPGTAPAPRRRPRTTFATGAGSTVPSTIGTSPTRRLSGRLITLSAGSVPQRVRVGVLDPRPSTSRSPSARAESRSSDGSRPRPDWLIAFANSPRAAGLAISALTDAPPADSPKTVTLSGSPPKPAMLSRTHSSALTWSSSPKFATSAPPARPTARDARRSRAGRAGS